MWDFKNLGQISIVAEIGQRGDRICDTCGSNRLVDQGFYFFWLQDLPKVQGLNLRFGLGQPIPTGRIL